MKTTAIFLETNERRGRKVDQIRMVTHDLQFYCDLRDDRDLKLAKRLAESSGIGIIDNRKKELSNEQAS